MSLQTREMVLTRFILSECEYVRQELKMKLDGCMNKMFEEMRLKLIKLVVTGRLGDKFMPEMGVLDDTKDDEQQLDESSNDTSDMPCATTNTQAMTSDLNVLNKSGDDSPQQEEQLDESSNENNDQIPSTSNFKGIIVTAESIGKIMIRQEDIIPPQQIFTIPVPIIPSTSTNPRAQDNDNTSTDQIEYEDDNIIIKNVLGERVGILKNGPTAPSPTLPANQQQLNDEDLIDELDEEDCDCPDCVGDLIEVKEEEGDGQEIEEDDDDEVQFHVRQIDESYESNPRPVKRVRLENDPTQHPNRAVSNKDAKVITVSYKCRECSDIFEQKHLLKAHLKTVCKIGLYRCLYHDCDQSMDYNQLEHHYNTAHSNNLHCDHCSAQFKNGKGLMEHYSRKHQEGLFQCAICDFTAEFYHLVMNHFNVKHKSARPNHIACAYCGKTFANTCQWRIHDRVHRGVKPFRCNWPDCSFGSAKKSNTTQHIRSKHLEPNQLDVDAKYYLDVLNDLL